VVPGSKENKTKSLPANVISDVRIKPPDVPKISTLI
jgi:hypothetical protein